MPAYNTGVVILGAALARVLVTLLDDFIWYAWRLLWGLPVASRPDGRGSRGPHLVRDAPGPVTGSAGAALPVEQPVDHRGDRDLADPGPGAQNSMACCAA